ncbi:unnamed protein product [Malus baccata var. baccata]
MATASSSSRARTRANKSGPVLRSLSPFEKFYTTSNGRISSSTSCFVYLTSSSFSLPASASPTRVNLYTFSSPSLYVRFSINHRLISSNHHWNRSITVSKKTGPISMPKKTCMCSLTSYSGSFRCNLHKNQGGSENTKSFSSNRLNMSKSAMTNSLVRISGVEGEWVKRTLTALIRPCAHQ